jgi:nucleotide-binding universal stress UspA family protein
VYRSILVPLDGSPFAEQALPLALSIARRARAQLDLVRGHVLYALQDPTCAWMPYDPAQEDECLRTEQTYLDATARWLTAGTPVRTTTAVLTGPPVDAIVGRLRASPDDLVVMTTHGRGPVSRFFLGSVADELIRRVEVPVVLVRPTEKQPGLMPEPLPARVLIPLDGSPLAEQILGPALDLARLLEVPCALLRVVEPAGEPARQEAAAYLAGVARRVRDCNPRVEIRVVAARGATDGILAESHAGDLVALATHGRGGLRRMLLGSVADEVIRAAPASVLVYHPCGE